MTNSNDQRRYSSETQQRLAHIEELLAEILTRLPDPATLIHGEALAFEPDPSPEPAKSKRSKRA